MPFGLPQAPYISFFILSSSFKIIIYTSEINIHLIIKFEKIKYYFSDIRKFLTDEEVSLENKFIYCEVKNYPSKIRGAVILFLFQFFDNFKGKFNQNDVQTFKRNVEVTISNAVNLIVTNNRLLDFIENPGLKASFKKDGSMSADEFFGNFEETGFKKGSYMKIPLIDCVYRLNERINYPKNKPLWYVYHAEADSSYGPLSSEDIEQMINSKLLEPESKLRLIDTFVYKGSKQFDFFPLKELQLDNFIDNIAISSLVYNFKVSNKNMFRKIDLTNVKDEMLYGKGKFIILFILISNSTTNNHLQC